MNLFRYKLILVFLLLINQGKAQDCAKDTFYILLPEDYILEEGFKEKYNVNFSKKLNIGKIENGVIEGCSTHYRLLYRYSSWHNRSPEEDFGLLRNSNPLLTSQFINKSKLNKQKVRDLKFIFFLFTGNEDFRFKVLKKELIFVIVKKHDFEDDSLKKIQTFSCDFYYIRSKE